MSVKYYCIVFFMICYTTMFSQKAFEVDAYGYISNPQFHELIKEKGYELVGNFSKVKKRSKTYYAKVLKYDQWGFIDSFGNEVIPVKYVTASDFKNGAAVVSSVTYKSIGVIDRCGTSNYTVHYKYELIDVDGNTINTYDYISPFYFDTTVAMKNGKAGMINRKGEIVVPFEYDKIEQYRPYTIVSKDKKWSYLNSKGEPSTDFIYDRFATYNGFFMGYVGEEFVLIDFDTGKQLTSFMNATSNFQDHNMSRQANMNSKMLVVKTEEGYFAFNQKGKKITSKKYTRIEQLTNEYLSIRDGDCWGVMNFKGKIIVPTRYDFSLYYHGEGIFIGQFNDEVKAVDARSGKEVLAQYRLIGPFVNGLAPIVDKETGKHGYINRKGKLKIPMIYDSVSHRIAKNSPLRKDSKWGVINKRGKTIIPFIYKEIRMLYDTYAVRLGSKWGLLDKKGTVLMPIQYESISRYYSIDNEQYRIVLNNKVSIVTKTNRVIIPLKYNGIGDRTHNGLLKVSLNGLQGFIDVVTGKEVIPLLYTDVDDFEFLSKKDGFAKAFDAEHNAFILDRYGNKIGVDEYDDRF